MLGLRMITTIQTGFGLATRHPASLINCHWHRGGGAVEPIELPPLCPDFIEREQSNVSNHPCISYFSSML